MPYTKLGNFSGFGERDSLIRAERIVGGFISAQEIVIAGGSKGIIRSDNFVAGEAGWKLDGTGLLQANNVALTGTITTTGTYLTYDIESEISAGRVTWSVDLADLTFPAYIQSTVSALGGGVVYGNLSIVGHEFDDVVAGGVFISNRQDTPGEGITGVQATGGLHTMTVNSASDQAVLAAYTTSIELNGPTEATFPDTIRFIVGSTERWRMSTGYLLHNTTGGPAIRQANGSVSLPTYTFTNRTDMGMYHVNSTTFGFSASGTQVVRMDSSGVFTGNDSSTGAGFMGINRILLNNSFPLIHVTRNAGAGLWVGRNGSNGSAVEFYRGTTAVGSISVTGSATAYNTSSDRRLKKNIKEVTDPWPVVDKLKPVSFVWKATDLPSVGLIAQDVQKVLPDSVNASEDGTLGMDYSSLTPHLLAAVKSLKKQVDALQREVERLS